MSNLYIISNILINVIHTRKLYIYVYVVIIRKSNILSRKYDKS